MNRAIHEGQESFGGQQAKQAQEALPTLPNNPYLLLTPGPLSTTPSVKAAMLRDWCTWDDDYNSLVQSIRRRLTRMASRRDPEAYTCVLMQGSGTFSVESVIGTVLPEGGKLAVLANGAYGQRIAAIARTLRIPVAVADFGEIAPVSAERLEALLAEQPDITHVAVVHCETTTGILNPIADITRTAKRHGLITIVDAMSSFGGVDIDMAELDIDFLISSSNKCIQGVPGFGFILARRAALEACAGQARSLSLDLYDQWSTMEKHNGKWRFTSPTHVVRAFDQALIELEQEGGVSARNARYAENQRRLTARLERLGIRPLLAREWQSPIITAFYYPETDKFSFQELYRRLKQAGYVIYPGKISAADTFRIGNIGDVAPDQIDELASAIESQQFWT
ncbi:2-aminoethylphosphonate--pyruvate transaminase [Paenibacillus doosanensis]|uniref:2-aminoethylphosphonate--pyruvate transaminase n=1 Tax=Paenibacillus doosanensis TaxID=1229154 RepID=UPI00217FC74E|nr:2-aminoethylphosphonate--pyruvate transaminase [Paenibacillus doosanensis]MCS7460963.1 2-aminoethylphosphonate--pyruvate transaminase [Paenibacillus doosanensis]